jgi:hypothetical protein
LFPARRGFALEALASLDRVYMLAAVERRQAPPKFFVELGKLNGPWGIL